MKGFIKYMSKANKLTLFYVLGCLLSTIFLVYINESGLAAIFGMLSGMHLFEAINEPLDKFRDSHIEQLQNKIRNKPSIQEERAKALRINYPLDTLVIYKGNDNELYKKGKVVGYKWGFPLIDNGEKTVMCMGLFRKDNPDRNAALDKLGGIDQWNVMAENYVMKRKA